MLSSNFRCAEVGKGLPRPWRSADHITAETTRMWLSLHPFMERLHEQECMWCPWRPALSGNTSHGGHSFLGWG